MGEKIIAEYKKLLALNEKINEELKAGGSQLDDFLVKSWQLMQKIEKMPAPKADSEVQKVHELLIKLVEVQKENQELIKKRMEAINQELAQVKTGRQAQRAYQGKSRDAKFLDQFK